MNNCYLNHLRYIQAWWNRIIFSDGFHKGYGYGTARVIVMFREVDTFGGGLVGLVCCAFIVNTMTHLIVIYGNMTAMVY